MVADPLLAASANPALDITGDAKNVYKKRIPIASFFHFVGYRSPVQPLGSASFMVTFVHCTNDQFSIHSVFKAAMKVLVADDSPLYRRMLQTLLVAWGYEIVLASDGHEARCLLDCEDAPRLALLDCVLPGLSGLDLCEIIRTRKQNYVYTILLSANQEQANVVRGFELGADDYLRKPFEEFELRARLKVGERIIRAHEELVEAREALKFEATHDSLVGLWNRKAIMDLLSKELSRAKRLNTPFSIFLADLDFFKRVNDGHGHLVGDDVLRTTATRITSAVREYDQVGRYGGEEFLVVLPDCTAELAQQVAERARQRISEEPISNISEQIHITASFGVCQWHFGLVINDLLHQADVAMYRAKHNGRNRVEIGNTSQ